MNQIISCIQIIKISLALFRNNIYICQTKIRKINMEQYTPIPLEEYLNRKHIKDLPQFVKDEIINIRSNYEYMPNEIFRELHTTLGLVKRLRKLKTPRTLWTNGTDIVFFNSYENRYDLVGQFYTEEFLEERRLKKEEEKRTVEENRARKKAEKQAKKTSIVEEKPVKPKRKRIGQ